MDPKLITAYPPMPIDVLHKKATSDAVKTRLEKGDFVYNQPAYEATLGPCEDRALYTDAYGKVYLGQWLVDKK